MRQGFLKLYKSTRTVIPAPALEGPRDTPGNHKIFGQTKAIIPEHPLLRIVILGPIWINPSKIHMYKGVGDFNFHVPVVRRA